VSAVLSQSQNFYWRRGEIRGAFFFAAIPLQPNDTFTVYRKSQTSHGAQVRCGAQVCWSA
jgi:hypothetical protein